MIQPQRLIDTAPLAQQNNTKLPNNQRNNLISTERVAPKKVPTNENIPTSGDIPSSKDRKFIIFSSVNLLILEGAWNSTNPGTMNFNSTGGNGGFKSYTTQVK